MVPEAQAEASLASLGLRGLYWLSAWTGRPGRDLASALSCATPDSLTEIVLTMPACEQEHKTDHMCILCQSISL